MGVRLPWFDHSNSEPRNTGGEKLQILYGLTCGWRLSHVGAGCGWQTSSAPPSGNPQAMQYRWPTYSFALWLPGAFHSLGRVLSTTPALPVAPSPRMTGRLLSPSAPAIDLSASSKLSINLLERRGRPWLRGDPRAALAGIGPTLGSPWLFRIAAAL